MTLLLLALLLQAGDAATTCHALRTGRFHEVNPLYGESCRRVVAMKAASVAGLALLPHSRTRLVVGAWMVGNGAAGVTINLSRR